MPRVDFAMAICGFNAGVFARLYTIKGESLDG